MKTLNLFNKYFFYLFLFLSFLISKVTAQIVPFGSSGWKYFDNTGIGNPGPPDVGSYSWKDPLYVTSDPGWTSPSGSIPIPMPIGYKEPGPNYASGFPFGTVISFGSNSSQKPLVTYYRRTINVNTLSGGNPRAAYSAFNLNLRTDDAAVVYFNGTEVARFNLPTGSVTNATPAIDATINQSTFSSSFTVPNSFPLHPNTDEITITVEIHQGGSGSGGGPATTTSSSDSYLDLELIGTLGIITPSITRGPYLQLPSPSQIQIRWATNTSEIGRVFYSTGPITLSNPGAPVSESIAGTDHLVSLSGLSTNTTYYYSVSNTAGTLTETSLNHKFKTAPNGLIATQTTRIWVTGDCSEETGSTSAIPKIPKQDEVIAGFQTFKTSNSIPEIDLWLLLGDNAYTYGLLSEYNTKFFNVYDAATFNIMKQTPIMPCIGNHDYYASPANLMSSSELMAVSSASMFSGVTTIVGTGNANSKYRIDKNSPYFSLFSEPKVTYSSKYGSDITTSDKKAYYSYNHNNIHFVCLDSYGFYNNYMLYANINNWPTASTSNPQFSWLLADLNAAKLDPNVKWTIMYWHHSPYTNGGAHNSDNTTSDEFILGAIRSKLIKYLDDANYKIDLVLNGHSHSYERSKLLKGHHGYEGTFGSTIVLPSSGITVSPFDPSVHNNPNLIPGFNSNANTNGLSCAYTKSSSNTVNEGTVYVVTGSAGQTQNSATPGHPALNGANFGGSTIQQTLGGSFYLEITGNTLNAKFIDETGVVADEFNILKDVPISPTIVHQISPINLPAQTPSLQIITPPTWPGVSSYVLNVPTSPVSTIPYSTTTIAVDTPMIGPIYTLKSASGCFSQNYRFTFANLCFPGNLIVDNIFDSPFIETVLSADSITSKSLVKPGSRVTFKAGRNIELITKGSSAHGFLGQKPIPPPLPPSNFFSAIIFNPLGCPATSGPPSMILKTKEE